MDAQLTLTSGDIGPGNEPVFTKLSTVFFKWPKDDRVLLLLPRGIGNYSVDYSYDDSLRVSPSASDGSIKKMFASVGDGLSC